VVVLYRFKLILKIISMGSCFALFYYARLLFSPKNIRIHHSVLYAQHVQDTISQIINTKPLAHLDAKNIYHDIESAQHSIEQLNISYRPSHIAHVFIRAATPQMLIKDIRKNSEYIITSNRAIVSKDTYAPIILENLKTVLVNSEHFADVVKSEDFLKFIHVLPADLHDLYVITWEAKTNIILASKNSDVRIISCIYTITDKELIAQAEQLYKTKNNYKKIDIRFKDMLICT
jgi:hypothetical protein